MKHHNPPWMLWLPLRGSSEISLVGALYRPAVSCFGFKSNHTKKSRKKIRLSSKKIFFFYYFAGKSCEPHHPKWRSEDNFFCPLWIRAIKSSVSVQAATALTHGATTFPSSPFVLNCQSWKGFTFLSGQRKEAQVFNKYLMTITVIHFRHFCYPHYSPSQQKIR